MDFCRLVWPLRVLQRSSLPDSHPLCPHCGSSCFLGCAVLFLWFIFFFITPWKKRYDKLSVLKSRNITFPTEIYIVKAMVLPVVMYRCESWTINKAERQRTDAFELHCWRRLLRSPWAARRSNQSILKEINPEYSLEGLMLKLKL